MTLRAVTSADLSWELSAIIYPAEIHRAKLMQFCPRKKDVASPTYFPLKHRSHRRREELCGCTVCFFSGDFKALTLILKLNNWAWICDHSCWQNGQVLFYCVCVCVHIRCQPLDFFLYYIASLYISCTTEEVASLCIQCTFPSNWLLAGVNCFSPDQQDWGCFHT